MSKGNEISVEILYIDFNFNVNFIFIKSKSNGLIYLIYSE